MRVPCCDDGLVMVVFTSDVESHDTSCLTHPVPFLCCFGPLLCALQINAWFIDKRDPATGEYPEFPEPEQGGSKVRLASFFPSASFHLS